MRKQLFYLLLSLFPFLGFGQLLSESFEGDTFPPPGWATFLGTNGLGTNVNWNKSTSNPYTGLQHAVVRYENVSGGLAEDWMVTPAVDLSNYENAELVFYTMQDFEEEYDTEYLIKVSTTSQTNHASFSEVASWNETTINTTYDQYELKTVDLSAYDGQIIYIAFVMVNDDGDSWYVDDVKINADEVVTGENCQVSYDGTLTNALGPLNLFIMANDFTVEPNTIMNVNQITLNVIRNIGTADVYLYKNNGGSPGELITSHLAVTPTSKTNVGTAFGQNVYEVVIDFPAQALEGGESGEIYWIGLQFTTGGEGTPIGWEKATVNTNGMANTSNDGGATWTASTTQDGAFTVSGTCEEVEVLEGCLEAENGQWPLSTYTPSCLGGFELITDIGFTGEYSMIGVNNGTEYTFAVSNPDYFITIGNEAGSTVLASGSGRVNWTATMDGNVRFYVHYNSECESDMDTLVVRSVQCGDPITAPDFECYQGDGLASIAERTYNISSLTSNKIADDFTVTTGTSFKIKQVRMDVLSPSEISNMTLNFRANEAGTPGEVLETVTMTPSAQRQIGSAFETPIYEITFDLSTPLEFEEGTYWFQPEASNQGGDEETYWQMTSFGSTGLNIQASMDGGATWFEDESQAVFFVSGECEPVQETEGCLEADEDLPQWPLTTFTPACEGTPEEIAANCWTGEYSVVQVTAGTEYIFSSSVTTDFITISDDEGTQIYASATGNLTWTSPSDQLIRFYLHLDSECEWGDDVNRSRIIQCGEFVEPTDYCEPVLDCTDADLIANVTFAGINNDSDCSPNGYGNYTGQVGNVEAGGSYPISVTVGEGWAFESVSVWIDYNSNFIFEEDEFTYIGTGSAGDVTGEILIPSDIADGQYRMRVRVAAVGEASATWDMACDEEQGFGETEDYTINVGELGISDLNSFDFTYYPNPVKDVLNISSKKSIQNVSVFNLAGQKMISDAKVLNGQINVSSLISGAYVFRVTLQGGQVETFKIIKK